MAGAVSVYWLTSGLGASLDTQLCTLGTTGRWFVSVSRDCVSLSSPRPFSPPPACS